MNLKEYQDGDRVIFIQYDGQLSHPIVGHKGTIKLVGPSDVRVYLDKPVKGTTSWAPYASEISLIDTQIIE